jgi:hypothetical protein
MLFLLRWDGLADAAELLLNVLDPMPRERTLLRIQVRDGGPRQSSLRAVHKSSNHLQVA